MNTRVTVERCEKCEELTPHSRRGFPIGTVVLGLAILAALCAAAIHSFVRARGPLVLIALIAAGVAAFSLLHQHSVLVRIRCERCREKEAVRRRRMRPKLGGGSEIMPF